jgi:putative transposase
MLPVFQALLAVICTVARSRLSLQLEVVALRHQLSVYQRSVKRPRIRPGDRILWSWLSRHWSRWRAVLAFVQPLTVIAWQRRRFREHWARISRRGPPGRPAVSEEIQDLIRRISRANPDWGSPRIVGELGKLGIEVAKSTIEKYRIRSSKPQSPTWRAFLKNHVADLVSIDFFTVPTINFKVLFVLVVLSHHRRKVIHCNVTENPTAQWAAQQIVEAFPWDSAPKYLLRDRDAIYGETFRRRVASLGIEQVLSAPRSPWQNPYVERLIGTLRRECFDHVIVLNASHARRILTCYLRHYHRWRTHLSLAKDSPDSRPVQPPDLGAVAEFHDVGGLHRHYERLAA